MVKRFVFKDLFTIAKIIKQVDFTKVEFKEGKTQQEYALEAWDCILQSFDKVENDIYILVASITDKELTEVKNLDWEEVFEIIKRVVEINDMQKVFTQAKDLMQK